MKHSPAPVVSTTAQGCAGTRTYPVPVTSRAPFAPSVRTTRGTPAANSASVPPSAATSLSLTKAMSSSGHSSAKNGRSGDGLSAVCIPIARACRSAAVVVCADRLPWSTRRSPALAPAREAQAASAVSADAAALVVMTALSPAFVRRMIEKSLAPPGMRTRSVSSGSAASRDRISPARLSSPRAAQNRQGTPARPSTIAWFAPLPPRSTPPACAWIDAPKAGRSSTITASSRAALPITKARMSLPLSN